MTSLGNSQLNAIYEADIPEDVKKPDESSPRFAGNPDDDDNRTCLIVVLTVFDHTELCERSLSE